MGRTSREKVTESSTRNASPGGVQWIWSTCSLSSMLRSLRTNAGMRFLAASLSSAGRSGAALGLGRAAGAGAGAGVVAVAEAALGGGEAG